MAWTDLRTERITFSLSGPVTILLRYTTNAFCTTKLLDATPNTIPNDRHKIKVLVTTACSFCSLTARILINVPGNINPCPINDGIRKSRYAQSGKPLRIDAMQTVPISMSTAPETTDHFRRVDHVIRKPVAIPQIEAKAVGITSRMPELVAVVRMTAWK